MNPLYILFALAGVYGLSRMSAASAAAAKTAAAKSTGRTLMGPLGAPGTPLAQLQATIKQAQDMGLAYSASTDRPTWLTTNHNPAVTVLNNLNHWATLLSVAGQSAAATQGQAYFNAHPEMHPYLPTLTKMRNMIHAFVYQDTAALAKMKFAAPASTTTPNSAKSAKDLITKAQGIVSSFPSDGSDASAYVAWIAVTAAQVPGLVSDIQSLVANASNTQQDISAAMAIIPQLTALVSKATSNAASVPSTVSATPDTLTPTPTPDPGY